MSHYFGVTFILSTVDRSLLYLEQCQLNIDSQVFLDGDANLMLLLCNYSLANITLPLQPEPSYVWIK